MEDELYFNLYIFENNAPFIPLFSFPANRRFITVPGKEVKSERRKYKDKVMGTKTERKTAMTKQGRRRE